MKKIAHIFRTIKFWLVKTTFQTKNYMQLNLNRVLSCTKEGCVWEEEEVVLTTFTIHFTLCLIVNYRKPPF